MRERIYVLHPYPGWVLLFLYVDARPCLGTTTTDFGLAGSMPAWHWSKRVEIEEVAGGGGEN